MSYFKKRLMFCVAGLDRGFAANKTAVTDTEAAIYSLVGAAGGAPTLSYSPTSTGGRFSHLEPAESVHSCHWRDPCSPGLLISSLLLDCAGKKSVLLSGCV